MKFKEKMQEDIRLTEAAMDRFVPERDEVLYRAMRYSLFAGGKRIRPVICMEWCRLCGGDVCKALPFAAALEMIHTYSLIHDDMPCMDNDSLRRGKPTCHVVYGESTALMAGTGLLTLAFDRVLRDGQAFGLTETQIVRGLGILSAAAGTEGILTGQILDLANDTAHDQTVDDLTKICNLKTGAMLRAAALLGCVAADADGKTLEDAGRYADAVGLAFQIRDDILDIQGDKALMGKTLGKDSDTGKTTFASLLGVEEAQKQVDSLTAQALEIARQYGGDCLLAELTEALCNRNH